MVTYDNYFLSSGEVKLSLSTLVQRRNAGKEFSSRGDYGVGT